MSEPNATPVRSSLLRLVVVVLIAVVGAVAVPAAWSVTLQSEREKARQLATEVAALDARIDEAVARYAQATQALEAVRASVAENRRALRDARRQVDLARDLLAVQARSMYKQSTPTTVDVLFGVSARHSSRSIRTVPAGEAGSSASVTMPVLPSTRSTPTRSGGSCVMLEANRLSRMSVTLETTRKAIHCHPMASGTTTASTAAIPAPIPNGSMKKPAVKISSTMRTAARIA